MTKEIRQTASHIRFGVAAALATAAVAFAALQPAPMQTAATNGVQYAVPSALLQPQAD